MVVKAFDLLTGRLVTPVAASSWSHEREVSAAGSFQAKVAASRQALDQNLIENVRPWRTVLVDSERVEQADGSFKEDPRASGIVYARQFLTSEGTLSCAGFGDLFSKLLVVNAALKDRVIRERVLDPSAKENQVVLPPEWRTHIEGSTSDMLVQLVELALEWQPLKVILPEREGGSQYRDYYSSDLATVADRVDDIAKLVPGTEWTWQPRIIDGVLYHELLTGTPELVRQSHHIDATLPGAMVTDVQLDEDGRDMQADVWGQGGKQDDQILIARTHLPTLEQLGWPRLMGVLTGHDSVSEIDTLAGYVDAQATTGQHTSEVFSFKVRRDRWRLLPGDHVDLKWASWFSPTPKWWQLKVLKISSDESEWDTIQTRERV